MTEQLQYQGEFSSVERGQLTRYSQIVISSNRTESLGAVLLKLRWVGSGRFGFGSLTVVCSSSGWTKSMDGCNWAWSYRHRRRWIVFYNTCLWQLLLVVCHSLSCFMLLLMHPSFRICYCR